MLRSSNEDYFNWLARILLKIFVVKFLSETEREIKEKPEVGLQKLRMVAIIFNKYLSREEERMLHINSMMWINEILVDNQYLKNEIEEVLGFLDNVKYEDQYADLEYKN